MSTNPSVAREAERALRVVYHALNVFGGQTPPTEPPAFAADRDLEDNLGRGYF